MHKIGITEDRKLSGASQSAKEASESLSAKLVSPSSKRPTSAIPRALSPVSLFQDKAIDKENSLDDIAEEASPQKDSSFLHSGTTSVSAKAKLPSLSIKIPVATTSINRNHSYPSKTLSLSLSPSINKNESPSNSPSLFRNQSLKIVSPKDLKTHTLRPTTASTACSSTDFESPTARPSRRSQRSSHSCRSLSPSSLNW
jgi:hypothetical protein